MVTESYQIEVHLDDSQDIVTYKIILEIKNAADDTSISEFSPESTSTDQNTNAPSTTISEEST